MSFHTDVEVLYRLLISFGIGTVIGLEREYRSKAAGLRTMIMICLGSTIFTLISIALGGPQNQDRIATAIVSGIGFLGAGVIFKDGLTVSGITTATTIWIIAALGMAVGAGQYFVALIGSSGVLIVLTLFAGLQNKFEKFWQTRTYRIFVDRKYVDYKNEINQQLKLLNLGFRIKRDLKTERGFEVIYEIFGTEAHLNRLNDFLKAEPNIYTFEY
jgi:putative Mg2+ transporter-C (MgtC) family protein